jgi:hypothetical protein
MKKGLPKADADTDGRGRRILRKVRNPDGFAAAFGACRVRRAGGSIAAPA